MKIMKKMSFILALALLVTVGGVYASWNYSRGTLATTDITFNGRMADIVSGTAKGTIQVVSNSNTLTFKVDDVDAADYVAVLVPTGQVQIQFKAAVGADNAVVTEGIKLQATVTVAGTKTPYNTGSGTVAIFAPKASNTFELNGGNKVLPNTSITITAAQIAAAIDFCEGETVKLDTYEDNLAFEQAMGTYTITVTISEVTA